MKATTLRMLVGVTAPLILTGSVQAGFLGIKVVSKPNQFGLLVCNIYAEFDRPGQDFFKAVAGTLNSPLLIEVLGGTFYNHAFGTNTAPHHHLLAAFPSLVYDTFVTIGAKVSSSAFPDATVITPGFPPLTGTSLSTDASGWAITPIDPQGDPFNSDYGGPGNGQILIGQFSTLDGSAIEGTMRIRGTSNGINFESVVSFYHVPGPGALWLLGAAGLLGSRRRALCAVG